MKAAVLAGLTYFKALPKVLIEAMLR